MYGMEEGGASAGRAEVGTVRCREEYAIVFSSSGRALIQQPARHRHRRDDVEGKSLSGLLLPAVFAKRALAQGGLRSTPALSARAPQRHTCAEEG